MMKRGSDKLIEDIRAVNSHFATMRGTFIDTFDMGTFGHKQPVCGTSACLAGWLGQVGKNEFKGKWDRSGVLGVQHSAHGWAEMAMEVYGMTYEEAETLFYTWTAIHGKSALRLKTAQVMEVVRNIKAREAENDRVQAQIDRHNAATTIMCPEAADIALA